MLHKSSINYDSIANGPKKEKAVLFRIIISSLKYLLNAFLYEHEVHLVTKSIVNL